MLAAEFDGYPLTLVTTTSISVTYGKRLPNAAASAALATASPVT